jgi:hypothetical protein
MPFAVAGLVGLGVPEAIIFVVLIFLLGRAVGKNKQYTRFCPKCGRGQKLPKDAIYCAYCGHQLP